MNRLWSTIIDKIRKYCAIPSHLDLCIYRNDPFVCATNSHNWPSTLIFLCYFLFFFVIKILINVLNGSLISATLITDLKGDVHVFPLFKWTLIILGNVGQMIEIPSQRSTHIPYLRDYADILVMLLMSMHMALIHKQWHRISIALSELWRSRIIRRDSFTCQDYRRISSKYNSLFNRRVWNSMSFAAAIILALAMYLSIHYNGMYSGLSSKAFGTLANWERMAYRGWWGHPSNGWIPLIFQGLTVVIILYYMFMHNVKGIIAVYMVRDIFGKSRRDKNSILFQLVYDHEDKCAGLGILREIMIYVYFSILIMGFSLLLTYYYIGTAMALLLLPFYVIFFVFNPLYVVVPVIAIHKEMKRYRRYTLSKARQELRKVRNQIDKGLTSLSSEELHRLRIKEERVKNEIENVEKTPAQLFSLRRWLAYLLMYLVPTILFVDWVARKLMRR